MTTNYNQNKTIYNIRSDVLVCLFLVLITLSVYWQVGKFEFVNYDDLRYITENSHVQKGLTKDSITWAFKSTFASNWHPLTWLSHMLDVQLYGINPGAHHLTNLFFHVLNCILLFIVFRRMTGRIWQSSLVAALFALHPLHIESVAWVAERKDVLSTFFWMLTIYCYIKYVKRPGIIRYLQVFFFFLLGLMAKPMLVTLPLVLLLLDFWPLCRFHLGQQCNDNHLQNNLLNLHLVWEKIPLFALSAASSIITFFVQQKGGAVTSLDVIPFNIRIANALIAYIKYIYKMIIPTNLSVLYPYPAILPWWQVVGSCFILLFISLLAIKTYKVYPYFIVGWLWYVGTLVPVIGLVQVGLQAMADRYTYVPLIGLFIIIAWGIPEWLHHWQYKKFFIIFICSVLFPVLIRVTCVQTKYWANSIALFERAIDVTYNNYGAHNNIGLALQEHNESEQAIKHYLEALRINPDLAYVHVNLGIALCAQKKYNEAIPQYLKAIRINPYDAKAHINMGNTLLAQGMIDEGIDHYIKALRINKNSAQAHNNLGLALMRIGKIEEAITHFRKALKIKPDYADAYNNLVRSLHNKKKIKNAVEKVREALSINPEDHSLSLRIEMLHNKKEQLDNAINQYQKALSTQPGFSRLDIKKMILVKEVTEEYEKTILLINKMNKSGQDSAQSYYYFACIYARQNNIEKSISWLKKAIKKGFKDWDLLLADQNLKNIRDSSYYKELIKCH